jgi:hypothetical protein
MTPFDIIDDITLNKKGIINDVVSEEQYDAFMVNKGLSQFKDTCLYAQQMNINYHLDKKLQFYYLFYSIRKSKRRTKWNKKQKDDDIEAIKSYYNYGYRKAEEALSILSKDQIAYIKEKNKDLLWLKK